MTRCALIVEDDADIRRLVEITLRGQCTSIDAAADGAEAMELLRSRSYDLVILDIMLPKVNGVAVAELVATLPAPPKIIILSAIARHFADRFPRGTVLLQKPFDLDKLAVTVAATLGEA
jgi:two-component system OmpR family response regulator